MTTYAHEELSKIGGTVVAQKHHNKKLPADNASTGRIAQ